MKNKLIFYLLAMIFLAAMATKVLAVTTDPLAKTTTPTPVVQKIDYPLPYPGILPDNPLYTLKRLRDWVLDKLVVDPLRKIELNVLQADKRIQMGNLLIEKGKLDLGESTISKGEKYLVKAVMGATVLKQTSQAIPGYIFDKLTNSLVKHEEVLNELMSSLGEGLARAGLAESLTIVKNLQAELVKLK